MDWAMSAEKRALLAGRENLAALETAGDVLRAHNGVCGDFVRIDLAGEFDGWCAWCGEYPPNGWRVVARAPCGDRWGDARVVHRVEFFGAGPWPDTWATTSRSAVRSSAAEAIGLAPGAYVMASPSGDPRLPCQLSRVVEVDAAGRPTLVELVAARVGEAGRVTVAGSMRLWPVPPHWAAGAARLWDSRSEHGVYGSWRWFCVRAAGAQRQAEKLAAGPPRRGRPPRPPADAPLPAPRDWVPCPVALAPGHTRDDAYAARAAARQHYGAQGMSDRESTERARAEYPDPPSIEQQIADLI